MPFHVSTQKNCGIARVKGQQAKLWLMDRDSTPIMKDIQPPEKNYRLKLVAVFNNDGHPDLFWRNTKGKNMISLMNGMIKTATIMLPNMNAHWRIVANGDFNRDGEIDLLMRH